MEKEIRTQIIKHKNLTFLEVTLPSGAQYFSALPGDLDNRTRRIKNTRVYYKVEDGLKKCTVKGLWTTPVVDIVYFATKTNSVILQKYEL